MVHRARSVGLAVNDYRRYHGHAAPAGQVSNAGNGRALMMYFTHSVEKGLSRQDFRPGFGERPVSALAKLMNAWIDEGRGQEDSFFVSACASMRVYFTRHQQLGIDVGDKRALFSHAVLEAISRTSEDGGVRELELAGPRPEGFALLATRRVSLREFDQGPVANDVVIRAIETALSAPSACNRQSARVHVISEPDLIDRVLRIQGGLGGYSRPPLLVLITSETSCYVEATERNQPFVDGALFAMSLIYALEDAGLGTCALTSMLWSDREKSVRQLLSLSPSEALVTFVAIGQRPARSVVPYSRRESATDITTIHSIQEHR